MADGNPEFDAPTPSRGSLGEIARVFLRLGMISFGGPVAHIGYFRAEIVEKRKWVTDEDYGDIIALCQFLPGPASSQTVYAIGVRRAGLAGGILASFCFLLPSAVLMIAFGYGVSALGDLNQAGWLHGLKLAAVAVVAQAVWGMGRTLCPDRARITLCLVSAAMLLSFRMYAGELAMILLGSIAGWWLYRGTRPANAAVSTSVDEPDSHGLSRRWAAAALAGFFLILGCSPLLAIATQARWIEIFTAFYRSGSLVFGGGHVVLPLLRSEVVPSGWVPDDAFLAGYGAAQAVPGPTFSFAGYLGVVMRSTHAKWLVGVWCLFSIFLPAFLLVSGALPFWNQLRRRAGVQAALRGANAAVVGVLLAALYDPVVVQGVHNRADVAAALAAFGLLHIWKTPPWLVVAMLAAVGQWVLR